LALILEPMQAKAVFIDKDGTLLENVPYNVDPGEVRLMSGALQGQIIFTGDESEQALIDGIRETLPGTSHSFAGELNLGELGALIALAPLLIVNNTGPAHIAAALGTPVVNLYALTNPQHRPLAGGKPRAQPRCAVQILLPKRLSVGTPCVARTGAARSRVCGRV
jgi:hypothetical protein